MFLHIGQIYQQVKRRAGKQLIDMGELIGNVEFLGSFFRAVG